MILQPALALLEFESIAAGITAGDAMVKRAPLDLIKAGTVQPGKYLVLIGGQVADVEEAIDAARSALDSLVVSGQLQSPTEGTPDAVVQILAALEVAVHATQSASGAKASNATTAIARMVTGRSSAHTPRT